MTGRYVLYDRGTLLDLSWHDELESAIAEGQRRIAEHGWHGYGRYLAVTDRGIDRN